MISSYILFQFPKIPAITKLKGWAKFFTFTGLNVTLSTIKGNLGDAIFSDPAYDYDDVDFGIDLITCALFVGIFDMGLGGIVESAIKSKLKNGTSEFLERALKNTNVEELWIKYIGKIDPKLLTNKLNNLPKNGNRQRLHTF